MSSEASLDMTTEASESDELDASLDMTTEASQSVKRERQANAIRVGKIVVDQCKGHDTELFNVTRLPRELCALTCQYLFDMESMKEELNVEKLREKAEFYTKEDWKWIVKNGEIRLNSRAHRTRVYRCIEPDPFNNPDWNDEIMELIVRKKGSDKPHMLILLSESRLTSIPKELRCAKKKKPKNPKRRLSMTKGAKRARKLKRESELYRNLY